MTCLLTPMKLLTRIGLAYLMNNSESVANRTSGKVVSEIIFRGIFVTTRNQAIYTNNLFQFFETGLFSFQKCLQFLIQITHITNK